MGSHTQQALAKLLADTYTLYLKTQNYHWHVRGPNFRTLHLLFEEQYTNLALAVDAIAERIVTLGGQAPASFKDYLSLASIQEGDAQTKAEIMVSNLAKDHRQVIKDMNTVIKLAQEQHDEGTIALLSERIAEHEKICWMLEASH
jgi:starvation-inducible DNA-binding protein